MKRSKKVISLFILLFIISNSLCCQTIREICNRYFQEALDFDPEIASQLGLDIASGFYWDNGKLATETPQAIGEFYQRVRRYSEELRLIDPALLTHDDYIEYRVFDTYLQELANREKFKYHNYLINPKFGIHALLLNIFTQYHQIESRQEAEDYLSRLEELPRRLHEIDDLIESQIEIGIIPPVYIIEDYLSILHDFVSSAAEDNVFFQYFSDQLSKIAGMSGKEKKSLSSQLLAVIREKVYPAYQRHIETVSLAMEKADREAGVWKLPEGDAYYRYCLQRHTTTSLKPQEIHDLGLREVSRIQRELQKRFIQLGIPKNVNHSQMVRDYWVLMENQNNTDHSYSGPQAREQVIADYQEIIRVTYQQLPELFEVVPFTPVTVLPVPPEKQAFTGQHYQPAPLDNSRPAVFYTNLAWLPDKPGMQTLLYHETIPGHHLQFALAREQSNSTIFRALTFFTGYLEGWALYAEKLAFEQGWFKDIYSEIAYLNSELFRAVRLVLDTGIHYKRWSRLKAANYMEDNLGWASYGELDRYIVWPGQACAYKVGELKILELREKAQRDLGDRFDLKEFHTVVLHNGAVPLPLLEEIVDTYIENNK